MSRAYLGVDVAKATLTVWHEGKALTIKNNKTEIRRFLKGVPRDAALGIETTSTYHLLLAEIAHGMGLGVYLLNPRDCARYRQAVFGRGKTDPIDARYIARYLEREVDSLRPFCPLPQDLQRLRSLLRRREAVVESMVKLELSFEGEPSLRKQAQGALKALRSLAASLEAQVEGLAERLEGYRNLLSVPGIGPLNAALALSVLEAGGFRSADAYVAYVGLDCRPNDSGGAVGKRAITKRGDRLLRKYLYLAAMSACAHPHWKEFYQRQLHKGLKRAQAIVALARKIARTVWSVHRHKTAFEPQRISCQKTS